MQGVFKPASAITVICGMLSGAAALHPICKVTCHKGSGNCRSLTSAGASTADGYEAVFSSAAFGGEILVLCSDESSALGCPESDAQTLASGQSLAYTRYCTTTYESPSAEDVDRVQGR